jgi:AcrR family transcriptional regulator
MVPLGMTARAKVKRASERSLLGREQWLTAAVAALIRGGLDAVAVEPLATSLGVTKGSFYWHFENRDALIAALVEQWEAVGTEQVIAELDAIAPPNAFLPSFRRAFRTRLTSARRPR